VTVTWSARALSDVAGIFAYVAAQSEEAAVRTADRLVKAAGDLARFPHAGRASRLGGRRELVVAPYVLLYRLRKDEVQIVTVEHGVRHG
jgi:plasmid stabilization system protein ParE